MNNGMRKIFAPIAAVTLAALVMSCGFGKKPPTRNYYIISYTPENRVAQAARGPYQYSLQIQRFEIQRIYSRQNIVYRYTPQELKWYEYQQWAVRPDYMFTDLMYKHFVASGIFNRVGTEFLETRPDFRLEGTVDALERLDAGDIVFAHLAMSLKMVRTVDGLQIWETSFDDRKQVYQKEMVYTVLALSQIMQTRMNAAIAGLDSLLASPDAPRVLPSNGSPIAPADSTLKKPDAKGYEIIPESRIKRK